MTFEEFKKNFQQKEVREISFSPPKDPVVSVLVQTYQQKDFIKECLDSILMQETDFDFEILIGEDGSTDGTRDVCIEYSKKYPKKIRLFLHHRENQIKVMGEPTSNFNAFYNFYSSRGHYYAFCEGDDVWTDPFKLQKHLDSFKKDPNIVMNYHCYETVDQYGNIINNAQSLVQSQVSVTGVQLMEGNFHPLLSTLCFKKAFKKIPVEMTQVINVDTFFLSLLGEYGDAEFLKNIHPTLYRIHKGGIWSHREKEFKYLSKIKTFQILEEFYKSRNLNLSHVFRKKKLATIKMMIFFSFTSFKLFNAIWYTNKYFNHLNQAN